jgi:glycine/D-amino acid oxidase-like deaminating enzyme
MWPPYEVVVAAGDPSSPDGSPARRHPVGRPDGTIAASEIMSDQSGNGDHPYDQRALDAIADAEPYPFWLESADIPESNPTLVRDEHCDLCIVGGGYTGLWTAVIAKERDPSRDVVLIDKGEVGGAASGRNGGFMEASLTHGVGNGMDRHADEMDTLEELGLRNLNEIEAAIERYSMDCDYERNGVIDVAHVNHPPSYLDELREEHDVLRSMGQQVRWLDQDAMRAEVNSPTYTGGLFRMGRAALVDPAKLAWELKRVAEELGVRIYEHTRATSVDKDGRGVAVVTPLGTIRCAAAVLGTNADKPLLKRISQYMVPVYDYCLVTEPLSAEQLDRIGWAHRQGLSDITNQFHYYRLTSDNRILWGGYDAIYFWNSKVSTEKESRPETWAKLSGTSSRRSRSSTTSSSPTPGAGRSTRAPGSRCSSGRRCRTGWSTPSATPASGWPPRGSLRRRCSTCSRAASRSRPRPTS